MWYICGLLAFSLFLNSTSAVFIYKIPWEKIDISVFSWQKALGSESQHGVVVMSPKAQQMLNKKLKRIPKILDLNSFDFLINTPSLLVISDLELCLDLYISRGGLKGNKKICLQNKEILDNWEKNSKYIEYFVKNENCRALTPCYFVFKKKYKTLELFDFLFKNKIAFDIENYRKAKSGIRIWTGPTIKSTFSWLISLLVNSAALGGLASLSTFIRSIARPPSLPPACANANSRELVMDFPSHV